MASTSDLQERVVRAVGAEGRGADDDAEGALRQQRLRALHGAHAAADASHGLRGEHLDQVVVRAAAHGGIEIDDLNLREGGEASQHLFGAVAFERLLAALHQLDDLAVHQIDTGNDQCVFLTGMPARSRYSFRSSTV